MTMTAAMRHEINAWVRNNVGGFAPLIEVGMRGEQTIGVNAINWNENDDLYDLRRLRDVQTIDECDMPGTALLDLYVTSGSGYDRELQGNVYVFIVGGVIVKMTDDTLALSALEADIFGFRLRW